MLEGRVLQEGDDVNRFLRESFGFINSNESTTGGELVRWLNYQQRVERKVVSFEKLQGNSFAVYCVTIPPSGCIMPDPTALRECAIRKYRYLDGVDNVLMLGGRVCSSL